VSFLPLSDIQVIDNDLVDSVVERALLSSRKRTNHNFHTLDEVYQRFLNVLTKGTYVGVHRHKADPKPETFLVLRGKVGIFIYDDFGKITNSYRLSSEGPNYGIDLRPGVWHNLVCLSEIAVCFEGKSGPYLVNTDKEFHPKYPGEGEKGWEQQLSTWESFFDS